MALKTVQSKKIDPAQRIKFDQTLDAYDIVARAVEVAHIATWLGRREPR